MSKSNSHPVMIGIAFFVGIVAISFSSIFVRWSAAPVSIIAMYRLLFTDILFLPFLMKYSTEIRKLSKRDWVLFFWSGVALGAHFILWMGSLRFTTVANSTALLSLEPVLVMVGSFLVFKHRVHRLGIIGMMVAFMGVVMIGWGDYSVSFHALKGDVYSILGTIAVAVHMLIGKSQRSRISAYTYSFFAFFFASLALAVYNVIYGYSFVNYAPYEWGNFLLLAIVPTVFGHFLFNWLLKYVQATSVSMAVLGEPIGSTILAFYFLGETINSLQIVAGFVLLFGVWLFIKSGTLWRMGKKSAKELNPTGSPLV